MGTKQVKVKVCRAGEPAQHPELFPKLFQERIELHTMEEHEWVSNHIHYVSSVERVELSLYCDDLLIGAMAVTGDNSDPHVNKCLVIISQFILPEYRNSSAVLALMREAYSQARKYNYSYVLITRHVAELTYESKYIKLR